MPHIHTEPGQHDFTVSAFIIRTEFEEPKMMLHLHKKAGVYMQFGGHIELHETPWQALAHELREETGYELPNLALLQPRDRVGRLTGTQAHPAPVSIETHPVIPGHFHTDISYAFVMSAPPTHAISPGESSDIQLFTRQEIVDLPPEKIFENIRELALYVFDVCLPGWERIVT